jgi:hypothetical protein
MSRLNPAAQCTGGNCAQALIARGFSRTIAAKKVNEREVVSADE